MSFAFMPVYTGDYLRDTRHLTPLRHGIYFLLLMHCWDQKGPLPLDEQECAGIANCRSADEVDALRYVLSRFFVRMEDGHYNKRMTEEVARAEEKSQAYREAGLRSAEVRRARSLMREAVDQQRFNRGLTAAGTPTPTPIPTPIKVNSNTLVGANAPTPATAGKDKAEKRRATRLPDDWSLPDDWRDWAVKVHGLDPQRAVRISLVFRDYWRSKGGAGAAKMDWEATWRNWIRKEVQDA